MKTKPYNRHETFLAALSDSSITVPTPLSREELYLAKIAGESVTIPDAPYNRYETYLAKLAAEDVTVPTPASRLEYYLYKACGQGHNAPAPASREEIFWARFAGYDTTGDISSFDDAVSGNAKNAIITITPTLEGRTGANLYCASKNIYGGSYLYDTIKNHSARYADDPDALTVTIRGSNVSASEYIAYKFKKDTIYTFIIKAERLNGTTPHTDLRVFMGTGNTGLYFDGAVFPQTVVYTTPIGNPVDALGYINGTGSGRIKIYCEESGIFEGEIAAEDFVPYNGKTYSTDLSFAGTVYGGTLDIVNGILTVTHAYIESYNNEDLPGEWISSEDVYVPGTKPTVGAKVVYKLDEADYEIYQIQPRNVEMLEGLNNIWSNAGPVSVTYIPDL